MNTTSPTTSEITTGDTLGDLVARRPHLAPVLERFGLDYCCGGGRTLHDAASATGIDPVVVVAELAAADTPDAAAADRAAWADLGLTELVDRIVATHHAYLDVALPRLGALADNVVGVHGGRHPELVAVQRVFSELRSELEPHLRKEEQVLFPMIRELDTSATLPAFHCGSLRNPISVMLSEHDRAGELLAELRRLTGEYSTPADGCVSYRMLYDGLAELEADTHLHVHTENHLLFPAAVAAEAAHPRVDG